MGLYEGTVQHIITGSYMLPNADDKRKFNVSKKKVRGKIKRGQIIYKRTQYTSFLDLGASVIEKGRITRKARYVDILKDRIYGIDM
jgi:hypothetical protein